MLGGGYFAGRKMRNSTIQGYPAPLVLGVVGLVGSRRARSLGGKGAGLVLSGMIGAGCYGAGKLGEKHAEEAGDDGNLFSWGSEDGFTTD